MIKELKLSNFRVFDDEVTIRFRPITVLIGKNNSGKSSIIKFLLMLQQSLSLDSSQFLNPEGEKVRLGNFYALKNADTEKSDLTFQLTVSEYRSGGDPLWRYLKAQKGLEESKCDGDLFFNTNATIAYEPQRQRLKKHEAIFLHDGEEFLTRNTYQEEANGNSKNFLDFTKEYEAEEKAESTETHSIEKNFVATLRKNISDLRHLLPVRQGKSRKVIVAESVSHENVGQDGKYTLPHLQDIIENFPSRYIEFLHPHIEAVADIKEIRFEKMQTEGAKCFAVNKKTGDEVLINEFGFGVSQCLPIFVQGALMQSHTSLMIEEPESHLHPTAQSELGSFFAKLWEEREVGSIIETHSNNILIRLRRLIAKGDLAPEDVSVAFFDFEEGKPVIRNLDIHKDGSMEDGLPMEFFHYDLIDGLHMGAGE